MSRRTRLLVSLLAATTILAGWLALSPHPAAAIGTADLAITMVGDKKHLRFGDTITFTVTVTNLGPDAATGVTLFLGVSDSYADFGGTCPDGSTSNICDLDTLASGASITVLFRLGTSNSCPPDRLGVAVASVSHDAETVDPISANDSVRTETKFVGKPPCRARRAPEWNSPLSIVAGDPGWTLDTWMP
jgi:uncharacterized repeat protein (TIGR01451 family)